MKWWHVGAPITCALAGAYACSDDETAVNPATASTSDVVSVGVGGQNAASVGNGGAAGAGTGGGSENGDCTITFCDMHVPNGLCLGCMSAQCDPELQACIADEGGAGGSGGAGDCDSCRDVINNPAGPSTANICASSQPIFDAFLTCVCGDGSTPGNCN